MGKLAVFTASLLLLGCERVSKRQMKSAIAMGDADAANQLLSGFSYVEGNSWRWTARRFVIVFPGFREGSTKRPHSLKLSVFVPDGQIQKLGPLTLTADVNGTELQGETFRRPGVYTYTRKVPETALQSNILPVTFILDKAAIPAPGEGRELGLVVNNAQLIAN